MEHGEKREAVMQAALELVGEHGFHGSPMALIAERAGVAAGTIYRFFDSKDTLIKEIYASLEGQLLAAVTQGYPTGAPGPRTLPAHRAPARRATSSARRCSSASWSSSTIRPTAWPAGARRSSARRSRNIIGELFEEAREQQLIKDLPLPILFALTFGPLVDICRDHILKFITLDDALIERTVEACWDAVRR